MDKISPVAPVPGAAPNANVASRPQMSPAAPPLTPATATAPPALSVAAVAAAIIAQGPPIDLEKVARVRSQIARGTFTVDPERLASVLLKMDQDGR